MRLLIVIVTFLWLCCSIVYIFFEPKDMKNYAIAAAGLIAFLTAIANYCQNAKKEKIMQSQNINSNSYGIQVGGNLHMNSKDKE